MAGSANINTWNMAYHKYNEVELFSTQVMVNEEITSIQNKNTYTP